MAKFEQEMFKDLKPVDGALEKFGFKKQKSRFVFKTFLMDGRFNLVVDYSEKNGITTEVFDTDFNEPYTLYKVSGRSGGFSKQVRCEVENVLKQIKQSCFKKTLFDAENALHVTEYIKKRRGDDPEHLWEKFPRYAVFRRQDNGKWYAGIFNVNAQKIGIDEDKEIEILIVRGNPDDVDFKTIFPGWHMNKKHWISLALDGRMPEEEIFKKVDLSYFFAGK